MYTIKPYHRQYYVGLVCALLTLSFSLLSGEYAEGRNKPVKPTKAALVFASTLMEGNSAGKLSPRRGRRNYFGEEEFSLSGTRDMYIYTYWKRLRGEEQTQRVRIYSPDGHLFQTRIIPFTTRRGSEPMRRQVPGIDNPVDVQQALSVKRWRVVTVHFPIAGTWVNQHEMQGLWRVEVYHNEAQAPIVSGSFTLTE